MLQDIDISDQQLKGEKEIPLKFVKFQDVQNIQFFVKNNQVLVYIEDPRYCCRYTQ